MSTNVSLMRISTHIESMWGYTKTMAFVVVVGDYWRMYWKFIVISVVTFRRANDDPKKDGEEKSSIILVRTTREKATENPTDACVDIERIIPRSNVHNCRVCVADGFRFLFSPGEGGDLVSK